MYTARVLHKRVQREFYSKNYRRISQNRAIDRHFAVIHRPLILYDLLIIQEPKCAIKNTHCISNEIHYVP